MATSLDDKLGPLEDDRRARIGIRAAELIVEEMARRELRPTEAGTQPRTRGSGLMAWPPPVR